ncbi:MAG: hypothetical protein LBF24_00955 [Puniceicoccales bacterium]|jgi:undecaprenyl-diphosphatase|nr:hypothetical protein [Puniceicoccales bacterium]
MLHWRWNIFLLCAALAGGQMAAVEQVPIGFGEASISGALQGLTEFWPVSSSAHLLILRELAGPNWASGGARTDAIWHFDLLLQLASALAILVAYPRRVGQLFLGALGRSQEGRRILCCLLLAFFPVALVGALLDYLHWHPSPPIRTIAWSLLLGGMYILIFESIFHRKGRRQLSEFDYRDALFVGIAQTIALFPGVSRSLMGLTASLALGLCPLAAVEFTFFLGYGTIAAAACYRLLAGGLAAIAALPIGPVAFGCGCAFLCAIPSLFFQNYLSCLLQNRSLLPFGYYRVLLGLIILVTAS